MSVTIVLIIINVLISWQALQRADLLDRLKHWPYAEKRNNEYSRLITGTFVHGSTMHLLFNMYALYTFGEILENQFVALFGNIPGRINYLLVYLVSGVFANMMTFHRHQDDAGFASVGASGSVSGIMFSFVIFYPWVQLLLFFVIPIPGVIASVLFLIYSSYAAKSGHGMIDHIAHFWGAVAGFGMTILFKPSLFNFFIEQIMSKLG
ncbi:MAG: rhomboid family intramembrane serine protease [Saprospiraceae bacterium]